MNIKTFDSPLIAYWYTDELGNKVKVTKINQKYKVIDGKIFLLDIPDNLMNISYLTINSNTLYEVPAGTLITDNTFTVDYENGVITVSNKYDGQEATIPTLHSRGSIFFPLSRIYDDRELNNGSVIKSLSQVITDIEEEASNTVNSIIDNVIHLGEYDPNYTYQKNNACSYYGNSFVAIKTTKNNPPIINGNVNSEYWRLYAKKGDTGANISIKGVYNDDISYKVNDVVVYLGNLYYCIQDSQGNLPTDTNYWMPWLTSNSVSSYTNTYTITDSDTNIVPIGISVFNKDTDILYVFKDSGFIAQSVDYIIDETSANIININGTWNEGTVFNFTVLKNINQAYYADGRLIEDGTISQNKFALTVSHKIDQIDSLVPLLSDRITLSPTGEDDTTMWNDAISNLTSGGTIELTSGVYNITNGILKSNINIIGRGNVIFQSNDTILRFKTLSSNVEDKLSNVKIAGIEFLSTDNTFSEFIHLVRLEGVNNIVVEECTFKGFRGDGVYLGSGYVGEEIHNENVKFINCTFDGINHENRNGISVIDIDGLDVINCVFKNTSRKSMPGAIDFEPNDPTNDIIRNIRISNCKFSNINGGVGIISVVLPAKSLIVNDPYNIIIENCDLKNSDTAGIYLSHGENATESTKPLNIKISNCNFNNLTRSYVIRGISTVHFMNNTYKNIMNSGIIGSTSDGTKNYNVVFENEFYDTIATSDGAGISIYTIDYLKFKNVTIRDAGKSDGSFGIGLNFTTGTGTNITLDGLNIISPKNTTLRAIRATSYNFSPRTNYVNNLQLNGIIGNDFVASNTPFCLTESYNTSLLPDDFSIGETITLINGDNNVPSNYKQGILKTIKMNSDPGYRKFVVQIFYPANNDANTLIDMYIRKGTSSNGWTSWVRYSGTTI